MARSTRTAPCSAVDAHVRLKTAQAYLEVAKAVLEERTASEYRNVSAGAAILAGIAAADAICGIRLGRLHRGDDHHGAVDLLRSAVPDGPKLAAQLQRLLSLKDAAAVAAHTQHVEAEFYDGNDRCQGESLLTVRR